jgi:dTDP-4-dehydrorhamnose reductase
MYNKVYIAGSGGMLGAYVRNVFGIGNTLCTDIDVNEDWIEYGDVRDYTTISKQIMHYKPDLIINLAALTDLEECEKDYKNCFLTNTIGSINLQEIAKELNVPYVFISTAGVFGGEKDFYDDLDKPLPLSIYAKSKVFAENYLLSNYNKTWIFRAGWMMGGGRNKDKKFINKIIKQIDSGIKTLYVVDDKAGTPTYTLDFAKSMKQNIFENLPFGIYNMVSNGDATRYDVACAMIEYLKIDVKVVRVDSDYFKTTYFAPRPLSERLINKKLNDLDKNYMRNWKTALFEYLKNFN